VTVHAEVSQKKGSQILHRDLSLRNLPVFKTHNSFFPILPRTTKTMKFAQALITLSSLVASAVGMVNTHKDQHHMNREYIGNSLWVFGEGGVSIYNPDGTESLKQIEPKDICHMTAGYRGGDPSLSCSFYDTVSDGKKYVWAAVSRGIPKIDILDIDTGDVVGSFATCLSPRKMEYHPLREEIWVRCSQVDRNSTFPSYMDVFSTASPSVAIASDMKFKEDTTINSWGYTVVDNTLGDVGYSTDWDQPYLFKLDLSDKSIIDKFAMPLGAGTYEVAYSQKNRHVFVRTSVCCTCGFEGADQLDCGRYGSKNVTITTGPWAGSVDIQGSCGRCDGVAGVDTLGVYEFDTTTDSIVGNHIMKENFGGDPFPSPDGKYIVLIGRNGGTTIRILEAGLTSEKSTVFADLELNFNTTNNEDDQVFNDFAFVEADGKNMIVFVSGTENRAAIVDLADVRNPSYVVLSEAAETSSRRNRRQVEWAVGTPYVWIDGTSASEIYVIDVEKKEKITTLTGIKTTKILNVQNYAKMQKAKMQQEAVDAAIKAAQDAVSPQKVEAAGQKETESAKTVTAAAETATAKKYTDDNDIDAVGIIGLIVGACALIVGTMNVFVMSSMKNQITTNKDDLISLGSKDVA